MCLDKTVQIHISGKFLETA